MDQSPPRLNFSLAISVSSFPMYLWSCAVTAKSPAVLVDACALPDLATADKNCSMGHTEYMICNQRDLHQ